MPPLKCSPTDFVKLEPLCRGSDAAMWKAKMLATDETVVLKEVTHAPLSTAEGFPLSLVREIQALRRLSHEQVIKLQAVTALRPKESPLREMRLSIIYEDVENTLKEAIARNGAMPTHKVQSLTKQLMSALAFCHDRGFVHRDVTCANLLITKTTLKLSGFGTARRLPNGDERVLTPGPGTSVANRAPELLLGATCYGFAVDMWSAGCVVAEMLLGYPLLEGHSEMEILHRTYALLGTPTARSWPGALTLPQWTALQPKESLSPTIDTALRELPRLAVWWLKDTLVFNPAKRQTAHEALLHDFVAEPRARNRSPPTSRNEALERQRSSPRRARSLTRHKRERSHSTECDKNSPTKGEQATIRINDIPAGFDAVQLQRMFSRWGAVLSCEIRNDGQNYALLRFATPADLERCMREYPREAPRRDAPVSLPQALLPVQPPVPRPPCYPQAWRGLPTAYLPAPVPYAGSPQGLPLPHRKPAVPASAAVHGGGLPGLAPLQYRSGASDTSVAAADFPPGKRPRHERTPPPRYSR
eukprot:TRINITY_DN17062_c0_g1_i1.p1 TRINITY_DN17062_c0_g1~~TRINITY_DN17062_c0_g1_i1.p1  ORF type:complete len:530 (+),score=50.55 TRINITY_DN17062_c0_g1_i1:78-1667(+)